MRKSVVLVFHQRPPFSHLLSLNRDSKMTIIGSHLGKRNRNISEKNDETIPHFKHKSTRFPNFRGVNLYFHGILC